ncbi:MAG: hypothetical protein ACRDBY_14185 [Cetobacterium sp.]
MNYDGYMIEDLRGEDDLLEEVRICNYCRNEIIGDDILYKDNGGNIYCCLECVLNEFNIEKIY